MKPGALNWQRREEKKKKKKKKFLVYALINIKTSIGRTKLIEVYHKVTSMNIIAVKFFFYLNY
jgi:hypothetical protein